MPEKKFAQLNLGKIYFEEAGPGQGKETIVFFHGFLGKPQLIDETAKVTAGKDRRVIGPSLPGHNDSFGLPERFLFPQMVETMEEFLNKVCPRENLVLIGHSLGGALAWEISARQNVSVAKAILINPGLGNLNRSVFSRIQGYFEGVKVDFPKDSGYRTLGLFFRQGSVNFKQLMQVRRLTDLVTSVQVNQKSFPEKVEVVIMWGKDDKILRLGEYEHILAVPSRIQIRNYSGGHHWFMAQPQLYLEELQKLL